MVRDAVLIPQPEFRFSFPFSITMVLALKPHKPPLVVIFTPSFMVSVPPAVSLQLPSAIPSFPLGTLTVRLPLP